MQQVSTSGENVSWLFIAEHSKMETAGAVERESQIQQVWDKVAVRMVGVAGVCSQAQESRELEAT